MGCVMSTRIGRIGESLACLRLRLAGHRILLRNWTWRYGELDLVTQRGRTIHIVEVKTCIRARDVSARMTRQKRRRVVRSADAVGRRLRTDYDAVAFDLVEVTLSPWPRVRVWYDVLDPEEEG